MGKRKLFVKYTLDFVILVMGISVSFWLNQVSISNQNNKERIKVLNSLNEESKEIKNYCVERKKNWQNDITILDLFINPTNKKFDFKPVENLTKSKSRVQFNLIYNRVFTPPTDRYQAIISSGDLKYIKSEKIKNLLSKIHITYSSYVQTTINYEKKIKESILPIIIARHPEIIIEKKNNSVTLEEYCNMIFHSLSNDEEIISSLILLEEYQKNKINWLSMYMVLIEDLETEIRNVLAQ